MSLETLKASGDATDDCLVCHSSDFNNVLERGKRVKKEVVFVVISESRRTSIRLVTERLNTGCILSPLNLNAQYATRISRKENRDTAKPQFVPQQRAIAVTISGYFHRESPLQSNREIPKGSTVKPVTHLMNYLTS